MAYFPLFVELKGKPVLVVGGGKIAARRVGVLLEFGCRITVVSPKLERELEVLEARGEILWKKCEYGREALGEDDAGRPVLVLAAAGEAVNRQVVQDCRAERLPVNDASHKENCDFYFPGIVKNDETVVGITSGGKDHKLAAALSRVVRDFMRETWRA